MAQFYPVMIALVFNGLDLLSGIIAAIKKKDLQSSKLRDGLFKKVGFLFCYFLGWLVDNQGDKIGFQFGVPILPVIVLYVCTTELVSIIENICVINTDLVPEKLLKLFHIFDEEEGEENGKH